METIVNNLVRDFGTVQGLEEVPSHRLRLYGHAYGAQDMRSSYNLLRARDKWDGQVLRPFCRELDKKGGAINESATTADLLNVLVSGNDPVTLKVSVDPGQTGEMAVSTGGGYRSARFFARREEFLLVGGGSQKAEFGRMWEDRDPGKLPGPPAVGNYKGELDLSRHIGQTSGEV